MTSDSRGVDGSDFIDLGTEEDAFTRGGNRLCFIDPRHRDRCIKVLRPDRLPALKRAEKSFPKNLKPLDRFDDNVQEFRVYERIHRAIGPRAHEFIPRLHGWVQTNFGDGLCSDLIRDADGRISITLKQYLWLHGMDGAIERVLTTFSAGWAESGMPSRNLLLHNLVVQSGKDGPGRILVIDGLGWPDLLPLAYYWPALARSKASRKIRSLMKSIESFLPKRGDRSDYGYHGWLEERQRGN